MEMEEDRRREREMKATLEQIESFKKVKKTKWHIDIPLWKMAIEGICVFLLAFLVGLGFAVLYKTIFVA